MSANSKIEWCDHTFNPWIGCTKVSPGCTNCYAEGESKRRGWAQWGKGKERHRTSANYWKQPLIWNRKRTSYVEQPTYNVEVRQKVFCASLADWLDDEVPIEWLADLLALIHATPNLDWLLLTKRPENWFKRLSRADQFRFDKDRRIPHECGPMVSRWLDGDAPENVWLGVSVEDQKRTDERILLLLQIPAKIRFLSCEPLLGPINLNGIQTSDVAFSALERGVLVPEKVDWVICGGESGHGARPMHPDWARSLRDQCIWRVNTTEPIAFFFKQWGEWFPVGEDGVGNFKPISERDAMSRFHIWPDKEVSLRVGKKHAGRLLDGREWNEFPQSLSKLEKAEAVAQ